jgi:hypothetical protein
MTTPRVNAELRRLMRVWMDIGYAAAMRDGKRAKTDAWPAIWRSQGMRQADVNRRWRTCGSCGICSSWTTGAGCGQHRWAEHRRRETENANVRGVLRSVTRPALRCAD